MRRVTRTFRFALRPKWIVGHVLAVVAVVGFINLGFWQLRRNDERATLNAAIEERSSSAPSPLAELLSRYGEDPEEMEYRLVEIEGTYEVGDEVLWQARTLNGVSGHDVLTPLHVGGRSIVVDRGWVPIDASGPPVAEAAPPGGSVVVTGMIRKGQTRRGLGPVDPATGRLDRISRVDIARLQQQVESDLYPFYVLLQAQDPQQDGLPLLQEPPAIDAGPHLSYAIQWFAFAAIAVIGYPVLLFRTAADEAAPGPRRSRRENNGSG